jgi:peptide methionine sulfoxide reductase MsrA
MYYHVYCYKKDAETIRVRYDSNQLEYKDLLKMFFGFHTPENPSWCGKQYRSAIFTFSEEQNDIAHEVVKEWGALGRFVSIEKASDFYQAEEYHQKYLEKW